MRLVLGIDEAGYGPRFGPLVVGACLLEAPPAIRAVGDDLFQVFGAGVSRIETPLSELIELGGRPPGVLVGDSKMIFEEAIPDELEHSALALMGWARGKPIESCADVLELLGVRVDEAPPFLADEYGRFPLSTETMIPGVELASSFGVKPVWLQARALSAAQYNQSCEQVGNKAIVNWALVAILIEKALESADADLPLEIVVDRQGGRVHYEDFLRELFSSKVEVLEKSSTRSAYALPDEPRVKSIEFLVGGDARAFCPGVASIVAKYVRELLVARINNFFIEKQPELAPSGGYFSDGNRFIRETEELRRELGIPQAMFVRAR